MSCAQMHKYQCNAKAPELSAHYGIPLEPWQVSAKEVLVHTLTGPLPTPLSIAVEEDQGPEVTSIIDTQDSLH